MTPIDPEVEHLDYIVYAKDQPPYQPLPTRRTKSGDVLSCW
jgi:hypothetical protein